MKKPKPPDETQRFKPTHPLTQTILIQIPVGGLVNLFSSKGTMP